MAEQPTPATPDAAHPAPPSDHDVLQGLIAQLRGASVVDNQVTRSVALSEADVKAMAFTLEQLAHRLDAHPARTPAAKA